MLWKKESRRPDALYIDICPPNTQQLDSVFNSMLQTVDQKPQSKKSDAIALEKRNEGNRLFRNSKKTEAVTLYSDSLRFANPGSEHISLAYANRSACFLSLKMYNECLTDIEYAMSSGYPEHLRPKLNDRKAKCLKEMQESPQHVRDKLTIEPDEKFPCMSNMVKIQRNGDKDDYSVVAKVDIDVGQVIAVEDVHHVYVTQYFQMHCNVCGKAICNLKPCEKCVLAMFCPECHGHFLHEYECGANICGEDEYNSEIMSVARDILLAQKMFATADELMEFVEKMLKRPNELPDNMLDDRSKYHAYFNCPVKQNANTLEEIGPSTYLVYKALLRIPHISEMFKTMRQRRFLMHLIGHHGKMIYKLSGFAFNFDLLDALNQPIRYTPVIHSYVKHSCDSNVEYVLCEGKCILYSAKPIKKGEQLLISHAPAQMVSTAERKKFLSEELDIKCECPRCRGKTASPAQRQRLLSDPAYRFIQEFSSKDVEPLMSACVTVLQQYGQMDWCDEIEYVRRHFRGLYKIQSMKDGMGFKHPLARQLLSRIKI